MGRITGAVYECENWSSGQPEKPPRLVTRMAFCANCLRQVRWPSSLTCIKSEHHLVRLITALTDKPSAARARPDLQAKLLQLRAVEVTTLEQRRRQFENPGLIRFEHEFLGALRHGAPRSDFVLIITTACPGDFRLDDNPGPTSGTGHAGAYKAISHSRIIRYF